MYLIKGGKKSITFPSSFIYVATKLPPSLLYILTYKVVVVVVVQTTNPSLEVQWCIFELSFVSFVCLQEAIPWWHFRSNWNTYSQTPKMTHQVDFGKPEILDLCGHYHLYTQYLLLCARYLSLTLLRSHKSPSNSLHVIPNQVSQKVFLIV